MHSLRYARDVRAGSLVFGCILVACVSACSVLAFDDFSESPGAEANDAAADGPVSTTDAGGNGNAGDSSDATGDTKPADPYGDAVRADGPVAWYRFEEDSVANAAKDSAGNLTANLAGGAMGFGAKGISGRGISTDGSGGGFDVGYNLGFAGKTPFSLEAWVKPIAGKEHYVFDRRTTVDAQLSGWLVYISPDLSPHFENWGTELVTWGPPAPAGWVHVVVTISITGSAGTAKLWVNGQPQPNSNSDANANTPDAATSTKFLTKFAGDADEIAFYDKALTAERILAHYLAGKP